MPQILILAAGASSRMRGADKLLEPVAGEALLRRSARLALTTGMPVTVVLAPDRPQRQAVLEGLAVRTVLADRAQDGMAASLQAGLAALPNAAGVMLLLADLPDLTAADLQLMLNEWSQTPDRILRACSQSGKPGHPVCFPAWARPGLQALQGDEGARALLQAHAGAVRLIALPGNHAVTDLDTPEEWAAWRAQQP